MRTKYSHLDKLLININHHLDRFNVSIEHSPVVSPASNILDSKLLPAEKKHIAGLMRINHTGEVCAQALYQGQAVIARTDSTRALLLDSADEEYNHLSWCAERLQQLDAKPSYLNPLFYAGSFAMGFTVASLGDKISLGFIAATEELVGEHLASHRQEIRDTDPKSHAILTQMHTDELNHAHKARLAGGWYFPPLIKNIMRKLSIIMIKTTYHL